MNTKVAINGLGRIGRAVLKLLIDEPSLELVAVNDLVDIENRAYLPRFDTVLRVFFEAGETPPSRRLGVIHFGKDYLWLVIQQRLS